MKNNIILSCILLITSAQSLHAETLDEAWATAINANHSIKAAQADTGASQLQIEAAQGQRLPTLQVSSGYTQLSETPTAQTQISGRTMQFGTAQASTIKAQAIASVPIYTSGRISHNINAAQATWQATQANEASTVLNLKLQVAESYVAVLRAESAVQVAQSHIDSLNAHAQDVQNRYDQGMVARNDVLAAHVEQINAEQAMVQAANALDNAKARYNQLLARQLEQHVSLVPRFPELPKGTQLELNEVALKQRPELTALPEQMKALAEQAQSIKANLLPQVSLNGGYNYQQNRYQAFEGLWQATVGVDWQLFDGSSNHRSDAITRQALALKEQYADTIDQIKLQVRQAWLSSEEARKRIDVTRQAIAQADENKKVTTDRYQQGLAINTDVLRAEELRTTTQRNLNEATFDAALATLQLRWAMGIL